MGFTILRFYNFADFTRASRLTCGARVCVCEESGNGRKIMIIVVMLNEGRGGYGQLRGRVKSGRGRSGWPECPAEGTGCLM
jgi:hypothetical protein